MKLMVTGLMIGCAAAVLAAAERYDEIAPTQEARQSQQSSVADRFRVIVGGRETGCVVTIKDRDGDGGALRAGEGCTASDPSFADLRDWRAQSNGAVAFLDGAGQEKFRFGVSDGAALESFEPRAPLIALIAID